VATEQTELFLALVGAVGTDLDLVTSELETELNEYGYRSHVLRLSDYLAELEGVDDFRGRPYDERVWAGMDAGTQLRQDWNRDDALALWAVSDIVAERDTQTEERIALGAGADGESVAANLERFGFILRGLKTRSEVQTLRAVYGSRFFLLAAYSPDDERQKTLEDKIRSSRRNSDRSTWSHQPEELIDRDRAEERSGGQDVVGTFHQADFFLDASAAAQVRRDVVRSLEVLFGHPFRTPTKDERAQFVAAGAALRSAELGRQVGAAIIDEDGALLAAGANEVPQVGGGSHWEHGEGQDRREFAVRVRDSNRVEQERLADELASALSARLEALLGEHSDAVRAEAVRAGFDNGLAEMLLTQALRDISEFGRAVHAEMDALLDAVRRGVPVRGATMHTTTFPCHNCARHIIGAGITRVVFVEPYEKSRARDLHAEDIAVAESHAPGRVLFQPFVGVAPRRYQELFDAGWRESNGYPARKDDSGNVASFDKRGARPVFSDLEFPPQLRPALPAYRTKELIALGDFEDLSNRTTPAASSVPGASPSIIEAIEIEAAEAAADNPTTQEESNGGS